jgi:hypothetical protein
MTSVPHPQADEDGRSQVFTLRERAAYPQLGCFPSFNEVMVLGTHPTKPYSRRIWFAPFFLYCTTARELTPVRAAGKDHSTALAPRPSLLVNLLSCLSL